jgi:hypothetical protein
LKYGIFSLVSFVTASPSHAWRNDETSTKKQNPSINQQTPVPPWSSAIKSFNFQFTHQVPFFTVAAKSRSLAFKVQNFKTHLCTFLAETN